MPVNIESIVGLIGTVFETGSVDGEIGLDNDDKWACFLRFLLSLFLAL